MLSLNPKLQSPRPAPLGPDGILQDPTSTQPPRPCRARCPAPPCVRGLVAEGGCPCCPHLVLLQSGACGQSPNREAGAGGAFITGMTICPTHADTPPASPVATRLGGTWSYSDRGSGPDGGSAQCWAGSLGSGLGGWSLLSLEWQCHVRKPCASCKAVSPGAE